jgi:uncharacterized integral membrane protein (TIGR00697 family)
MLFQRIPLPLPLRNSCSLFCSQAVDTILFTFLGLYGIVSSLVDIMTMSFVIKVLIITLFAPFLALAKKYEPSLKS